MSQMTFGISQLISGCPRNRLLQKAESANFGIKTIHGTMNGVCQELFTNDMRCINH